MASCHCNYTDLDSLSVPPPVAISHTLVNVLDALYEYYDSQLSSLLDKADSMISQMSQRKPPGLTTWPTPHMDYLPLISSCFVLHSAVSTALFAAVLLIGQAPYPLNGGPVKAQNLLSLTHPTPTEFASIATSRSNKVTRIQKSKSASSP